MEFFSFPVKSLSPEMLLRAYRFGVFPMADSKNDPAVYLVDPVMRGVLPLDGLKVSRRLRRYMNKSRFQITFDQAFGKVLDACAEREQTWINQRIKSLYLDLHSSGYGKSVEVWDGSDLIGGLYGVAIERAFFGESMFSKRQNTSKIALFHLIERLNKENFILLDTQFITDHLRTLGAIEITRARYHELLHQALGSGLTISDRR